MISKDNSGDSLKKPVKLDVIQPEILASEAKRRCHVLEKLVDSNNYLLQLFGINLLIFNFKKFF